MDGAGRRGQGGDGRRRRVYAALLPAASVAAAAASALCLRSELVPRFYGGLLVVLFAALALLSLLSWGSRAPQRALEVTTLLVAVVFLALLVWFDLYVDPLRAAHGDGAYTLMVWLPLLYVLVFLSFEPRRALRYAAGVLLLVVALTLPHALATWGQPGLAEGMLLPLQVYVASVFVLWALYAFATLQTRLQRVEATAEAMRELANTDALTGLANRRRGEETLQRELRRALRYQRPLAVLLLDLDDFKRVNDELGHPAGDEALLALAERLRRMLRTSDTVARWGGEEFLILTPETDLEAAVGLAEVIRGYVRDTPLVRDRTVTASLGVAALRPGDRAVTLLQRADEALYRAKAAGKDRVARQRADEGG